MELHTGGVVNSSKIDDIKWHVVDRSTIPRRTGQCGESIHVLVYIDTRYVHNMPFTLCVQW